MTTLIKPTMKHLTEAEANTLYDELKVLTMAQIRERYPLMRFGDRATKATMLHAILVAADKEAAERPAVEVEISTPVDTTIDDDDDQVNDEDADEDDQDEEPVTPSVEVQPQVSKEEQIKALLAEKEATREDKTRQRKIRHELRALGHYISRQDKE
jgi:hypothetical protein